MVMPALLFVAGHRPLAFVLGQTLLVLQPLAALLGAEGLRLWGELLSQPDGLGTLTERLAGRPDGEGQLRRGREADL